MVCIKFHNTPIDAQFQFPAVGLIKYVFETFIILHSKFFIRIYHVPLLMQRKRKRSKNVESVFTKHNNVWNRLVCIYRSYLTFAMGRTVAFNVPDTIFCFSDSLKSFTRLTQRVMLILCCGLNILQWTHEIKPGKGEPMGK